MKENENITLATVLEYMQGMEQRLCEEIGAMSNMFQNLEIRLDRIEMRLIRIEKKLDIIYIKVDNMLHRLVDINTKNQESHGDGSLERQLY